MNGTTPEISVIVPTYNRAAALPRLVKSLTQQTLDRSAFEVLIVDDGSTDETQKVLHAQETQFPLRVLRQQHSGASRARNHAAAFARGKILAFTDDDCCPEAQWLSAACQGMKREEYRVALLGITTSEYPASTFVHSVFKDSEPVVSCNLAVPREAFEKVGGFDEHFELYYEDEELGLRLKKSGYPIVVEPAMRVHHPSRYQSFRGFLRLRKGQRYLCYMTQRHPENDHWERQRPILRQVYRKILFLGSPLLATLFWHPAWIAAVSVLGAHLAVDAGRAWQYRRRLKSMHMSLKFTDLLSFTCCSWAVPFWDASLMIRGWLSDRGSSRPWTPEENVQLERRSRISRIR